MYLNVNTAISIFDYASLVDEAADQIDRDDLGEKWPRFVQLVEAFLRRRLRVLDMEATASQAVSSETAPVPDDCLSIRSISFAGEPDSGLRAVSPAAAAQEFGGWAAKPVAYARVGDTIRLYPPPDGEYTLEFVYLAKFTPLTAESVTNWVMDDHPDIYFWGILAHACDYIGDNENATKYAGAFTAAVDGLVEARKGDKWASGLQVPATVMQVGGARC